MRRCTLTLLFTGMAVLLAAAAHGQEQTYAERLGWPAGSRVLIIHCDDLGMSLASNRGAFEAYEFGLVSSMSIMMPTPWVTQVAEYVKQHPEADTGLHLTLTSEWDYYRWGPVSGKPAVPGLCDPHGYLWDSNELLAEHATPDEVEKEIRAQIDKAVAMGIDVTHLDTHMGSLLARPEFIERAVKVAIERDIPIMMAAGHLAYASKNDAEAIPLIQAFAQTVWDAGLPVIDDIHTASYNWRSTNKQAEYIEFLRTLEPGVTQMIVHCTKPDDVIGAITGNRDHLYGDYYALADPEVKRVLEEEGIILTTWRELKQRRKAVPAESQDALEQDKESR